jgi:DNA-directed RNA polymerase specialized sigma24 family protein
MADGADLAYSTRVIGEHHDLLVGVAYRVLGSVTDAENPVQEAWLRWSKVDPAEVANPRAFLVRVTTRLAIDRLRRAKARRESYVGPWLHEPVLTGHDVAEEVELAESVSMAMLVVLETLSPLERAVFVLREAFEIDRDARFEADQETRRHVTERFLEAAVGGDVQALMEVLAPGVTLVADGGGRARARVLGGAESKYAAEMLARKYPILHGVLIPRLHRLRGNRTIHIELTPVTS